MESDTGAGPLRANSSSVRRKRAPRVTSSQIDALLATLEDRPFLHTRKFTGLQGRENYETGWKMVAGELNNLPNGSIKTPEQWMTVWRDLKSRACNKAAKLRKERIRTGNRGVVTAPLTEVERRIISLIGVDYTFGTDCPDAMPEEDSLQHDMEAGVASSEVLTLPVSQIEDIMDFVQPETTISDSRATAGSSPPPFVEQVQDQPTSQSPEPQRTGSGNMTEAASSATPQRGRASRSRRGNLRNCSTDLERERAEAAGKDLNPRQSVAEQYGAARREFLAVAEANAEAMRVLAAATEAQADAAKMQAEAAKVQAEASLLFAQAASKIADAIVQYVNKNNN